MKTKTIMLMLAILFFASILLTGCNLIPEEYTKGVRLDSSYPEDDLPIIDDAVIYYCDADDENVTIKYGTEEDLDDVADFYKDHFEDNDITLEDETDKSSRYSAEGSYKNFVFDLRASQPSDGYESQLFKTTIRIEIEFTEEIGSEDSKQAKEQLLGFWRQESMDDDIIVEQGIAINFFENGTADLYTNFIYDDTVEWEAVSENTIIVTLNDGTKMQITVTFEQKDEKEYFMWESSLENRVFFRGTSEQFLLNDPDAQNQDSQLALAIADKYWYFVLYSDVDGNAYTDSTGYAIYNSDGSFEESYNGMMDFGTWYIQGGRLCCTLDDGSEASWPIEVMQEPDDINFLYFYDDETAEYWMYSDQQQEAAAPDFVDIVWYGYSYYDAANGSIDLYAQDETLTFNSDYTITNVLTDGTQNSGTWDFDGITANAYFDSNSATWDLEIEEYSGINFLYLSDYRPDKSGSYWIFTDVSLIYGPVKITDEERFKQAILDDIWYSVHYIYPDGETAEMTETTIIFNSDGSLDEMFGGEALPGFWSYSGGVLHIEYPTYDEIHDYPNTYIEYDPESDSMSMYMGDEDPAYAGGHWLFTTYEP